MAVEAGDKTFKSKLDEASKKKAKAELNELNDADRENAVQTLRQWVIDQPWLRSPTDFEFLLRFLRARKYSQLSAREYIENYWTIRNKTPEIFSNIDPAAGVMQDIIRNGWMFGHKRLDKFGRRVAIIEAGKLKEDKIKKKWGVDRIFQLMVLFFEWLMFDENVQVNGVVFFIDDSEQSLGAMVTVFASDRTKKLLSYIEHALPMRLKAIHIYNQRTFFDIVDKLTEPFMKQKTRERKHMYGKSLVKVYEDMGMSVLPREYLPDDYTGPCAGTTKVIIEEMLADMTKPKFREHILNLTSDKYGVDLDKKVVDKDVPVASFRKLNVD